MSGITTHVLDVSTGKPATGVTVKLERETNGGWETIGSQSTDTDGRSRDLIPEGDSLTTAVYRLTFDVRRYFSDRQVDGFYRDITIAFLVKDASQHYHIPLLLSPFGYSTYRGS